MADAIDAVAEAIAEALTAVCGARLGGEATAAPSELPAETGWLLTVPIGGSVEARVTAWFETSSAAACARAVGVDGDAAIEALLVECMQAAVDAVKTQPACAGLTFGAPAVSSAPPSPRSRAIYVAVPNTASCLFAVGVERARAAIPIVADDRLGAVLEIDLPLVVRFGQTVMPLRELAELGPGSVIDMGRSPDEPVELLVGERLLARGDVVVVGGNYGIRITELAAGSRGPADIAGRDRAVRKETRAS